MHELYELKEMLCKELEEYGQKGELSTGSLEVIDKLAHSVKNIGKIIEMCEEEEYSSNYGPYEDGMGGSYARGGNRGANQYGNYESRGGSYKRDSRGRYSRDDGMVEDLRELMHKAPNERTKQEFQKFIHKLENM